MNIFVTLDRNYLEPLKVMLGSLLLNNFGAQIDLYLACGDIEESDLKGLRALCIGGSIHFHFLEIDRALFAQAPTGRYYSQAMYYRLLAAQLLPDTLDRALYLDPDVLVINDLRPLYDLDMADCLYAAAMHRGLIGISAPLSKIRLNDYEADEYYNSGVLLMNLPALRREAHPEDIFDYVEKNRQTLILPDQDVLNALYGTRIFTIDERLWNYDARKYETYRLASQGKADLNWLMQNTAILHFCGKSKPWKAGYRGRFSALYKHYQSLIRRLDI